VHCYEIDQKLENKISSEYFFDANVEKVAELVDTVKFYDKKVVKKADFMNTERGDFFGEMSLIDGEPRSASVRTVTDAQLLIIHRESFLQLIRQSPEIAMGLLSEMSKRLRKANRQIGSLSTMSVSGRVAGTLLNLMQERGVRIHTDGGKMVTVIHNRPTQQQLADMSGTTRETVSRICSLLVRTGAIAMTGKDIVIFDENALQERATKG